MASTKIYARFTRSRTAVRSGFMPPGRTVAASSDPGFAMPLFKRPIRTSLMAAGLGLAIIALAAIVHF